MSGEYSMPCQRCPKRSAVQGKIDSTLACVVFAAVTGRDAREVRLCGTCLRTGDKSRPLRSEVEDKKGGRVAMSTADRTERK